MADVRAASARRCTISDTQTTSLGFAVSGLPPIKNEVLSLFSAGHRQAARVRALLLAACEAIQHTGWTPLVGPVGLDVVLRSGPDHYGDATYFLGGIAGVLQDKSDYGRPGMAHLGPLVDIALYHRERQLRQISYREEDADEPSYTVQVRALDPTVR